MSDITSKICFGCGEDKPFSEYRPFPAGAFGLRPKCRGCEKKQRDAKKEQALERQAKGGMKFCPTCATDKPLSEFMVAAENSDGLHKQCLECYGSNRREKYFQNPEPHKLSCKKWIEKNPEKQKAIQANHVKKFKAQFPHKAYAQEQARYALRSGRLDRKPCEICGNENTSFHHPSYHPDHVLWVQNLCDEHHHWANLMPEDKPKVYTKELDEKRLADLALRKGRS